MNPQFTNPITSRYKPVIHQTWPALFAVLCSGVLLMCCSWGLFDLYGPDESRISGIANGMVISGNRLFPQLNGVPFFEKPPLFFWGVSSMFSYFGKNADMARLIPALAAIGIAGLIFLLAKEMKFSLYTSSLAGMIVLTNIAFLKYGWKCVMDMPLAFFTTGAVFSFYLAYRNRKYTVIWGILYALMLGGALMTKALVGVALPCIGLTGWMLWKNRGDSKLWMVLILGVLIACIPFAFWLYFFNEQLGMEAVTAIVWENNFARFLGTQVEQAHMKPFFYYFKAFPEEFLPWTLFVPAAILFVYRSWRHKGINSDLAFILSAIVLPFLLLTSSSSKRPIYLLPIYPFLALLVAISVERLWSEKSVGKWLSIPLRIFHWGTPFAAIGLTIACVYLNSHFIIYLILGLVSILISIKTLWKPLTKNKRFFLYYTVPALCLIVILAKTGVYPEKCKERTYKTFFEKVEQRERDGSAGICLFMPRERLSGAAVYYPDRMVPFFRKEDVLLDYLEKKAGVGVLSIKENLKSRERYDIFGHSQVDRGNLVIAVLGTKKDAT